MKKQLAQKNWQVRSIAPNVRQSSLRTVGAEWLETRYMLSGTQVADLESASPRTELSVHFTTEMSTSGGPDAAHSIFNRGNWRLLQDGIDVSDRISSINHSSVDGRSIARLTFATTLPENIYRLVLDDAVQSASGIQLDGDRDGIAGGDFDTSYSLIGLAAFDHPFHPRHTHEGQFGFVGSAKSVDSAANGDFVVAWRTGDPFTNAPRLCVQLYHADGTAKDYAVKDIVTGTEELSFPSVAVAEDGKFVIAWASPSSDRTRWSVYARRYDQDGAALGDRFLVDTIAAQSVTDVTALCDDIGDFIIVWRAQEFDGSRLYAQRYTSGGSPKEGKLHINPEFAQGAPEFGVDMNGAGQWVVALNRDGGHGTGIYVQVYSASATSSEFFIPAAPSMPVRGAAISAHGDLLIAWEEEAVRFQQFNLTGTPEGNPVVTDITGSARLTADSDGGVFLSYRDASTAGWIQHFNAVGLKVGTYRAGPTSTEPASIAVQPNRDFVAVYQQQAVLSIIKYGVPRVFDFRFNTSRQIQIELPAQTVMLDGTSETQWFELTDWQLFRNGQDISSQLISMGVGFDEYSSGINFSLSTPFETGEYRLRSKFPFATKQPGIALGHEIDGDRDGLPGGLIDFTFRYANPVEAAPEVLLETGLASAADNQWAAADAQGNYVLTWCTPDGAIYVRRFSSENVPLSAAIGVNPQNIGSDPSVAVNEAGRFAVAWVRTVSNRSEFFTRAYDAAGNPLTEPILVKSFSPSTTLTPTPAIDATGAFLVAWPGEFQRFNPQGQALGSPIPFTHPPSNPNGTANVLEIALDMDSAGNFVICWSGSTSFSSPRSIYAQRFTVDGQELGNLIDVNRYGQGSFTPNHSPDIALGPNGDFVVTWLYGNVSTTSAVYARRFGADGRGIGPEFQINRFSATNGPARVEFAPDSSFTTSWPTASGLEAIRYGADGRPAKNHFYVVPFLPAKSSVATLTDVDGNTNFLWIDASTRRVYAKHFLAPFPEATLSGRHLFYNRSRFDGNDAAANSADDLAIAPDKRALLPGETATFANYTNYLHGINGLMIDVENLAGTPTLGDFSFKIGNDNNPLAWQELAVAPTISVRNGAGVNGSDRVTLTWPDGSIVKTWLEVTMHANDNTGLAIPEMFYVGNAIGEAGHSAISAQVTAIDEIFARNNPRSFTNPAEITFRYDYNRDGRVSALDQIIARNNRTTITTRLNLITPPPIPPGSVLKPQGLADVAQAELLTDIFPVDRVPALADPTPSANKNQLKEQPVEKRPSVRFVAQGLTDQPYVKESIVSDELPDRRSLAELDEALIDLLVGK